MTALASRAAPILIGRPGARDRRCNRVLAVLAGCGGMVPRADLRRRLVTDGLIPDELTESAAETFRAALRRLEREGRIFYDAESVVLKR